MLKVENTCTQLGKTIQKYLSNEKGLICFGAMMQNARWRLQDGEGGRKERGEETEGGRRGACDTYYNYS